MALTFKIALTALTLAFVGAQACGGEDDIDLPFEQSGLCDSYLGVEAVGTLPGKADEVSGLVVSHRVPGVLWAVNDGNDLRLLAIAAEGDADTVGEVALPDPGGDSDIEDLAWGPCSLGGESECLYVGDIGDNDDTRSSIHLLRLTEPDPFSNVEASGIEIVTLTYEDGPRDAEAFVIGPQGDVYIFAKAKGSVDVWWAPFEAGAVLTRVDSLDLSSLGAEERVRGAALDYEDGRLLLRTDSFLLEFCLEQQGQLKGISAVSYHVIPSEEEPQGESVALDGDHYWHTSEGEGEPIYRSTVLP